MQLTLIEEFLLLALDNEKGEFLPNSLKLNTGFAGAVLFELLLQDKIQIDDKLVIPQDVAMPGNKLLSSIFEKIKQENQPKTIERWVQLLFERMEEVKKATLESLTEKGILATQEKKVLWVFHFKQYPELDGSHETQLRQQLKKVVLHGETPKEDELLLLILIKSCGLLEEVFGDKQEEARHRIDNLTADTPFSKTLNDALLQLETTFSLMLTP